MSEVSQKLHIENVDEEIEIEVSFDYQPEENQTRDYPGCSADVEINEVIVVDSGAEICLLPKELERISEDLLIQTQENMVETKQYKRYGYMMEDY